MATTKVLMLNSEDSESDYHQVELPVQPSDIQFVGGGTECLSLITKEGKVYSNRIKDCELTKWKQPPGLTQHTLSQVESGLSHCVALTTDQKVITWGENSTGQLGRKTTCDKQIKGKKAKMTFFNASPLTSIQSIKVLNISCGDCHNLCLSEEGHVYSWGANDCGQLGRKNVTAAVVPQIVKDLENIPIIQVSAGGSHSIALSGSGQVFCWGSNRYGQLGLGPDNTNRPLPMCCPDLSNKRIDLICCGQNHTAILTRDGDLFTCGFGSAGQLGHNSQDNEYLPRQIENLTNVSQIACGRNHTLALVKSTNHLHIFGFGMDNRTTDLLKQHLTSTAMVCGGMCSFVYQISSDEMEGVEEHANRKHKSQLLTLDSVQDAMNQSRDKRMDCVLERALSHASCINGSFHKNANRNHVYSESDHDVDFERAECFFSQLRLPYYFDMARKALKKLMTNLIDMPLSGIERLRLFLLLPCCLYVDNNVYDEEVVSSLARHLCSLGDAEKIHLGKWLRFVSTKFFKRYVWCFKMCGMRALQKLRNVYNITECMKEETTVKSCVEVLDMLNEVNLLRGLPIPFEKFYLNDLIDKINIQGDFLAFKQDRQADKESEFHFCKYPFLYNSACKFLLLKCQCERIMEFNQLQLFTFGGPALDVRRDHIVEDTRSFLSQKEWMLKQKFNVTFQGEITYSGNGIRQEFFVELFTELLDPKFGVFYEEEDSNAQWFIKGANLEDAYFVGLMCGLAMYNSVTLNLQFPPALYKKLLKMPLTLKDLFHLKPMNYRSLEHLMKYPHNDMEDMFCIDFTVSHQNLQTEIIEDVELCPNGKDIPVTQDNKEEYVEKVKEYYLNTSIEKEFQSFCEGFYGGIPKNLLNIFQPKELEDVLVGNERYDFEAFEKVTEYGENYTRNHQTIKFFWEVFHQMEVKDQKAFLRFLTGTHRIPVYGIKRLKMTILPRHVDGASPDGLLPLAFTCTNSLMLPCYTNKDSLERKIMFATQNYTGFGHFSPP